MLKQILLYDSIDNFQSISLYSLDGTYRSRLNYARATYRSRANFIYPNYDFLIDTLLKYTVDSAEMLKNELNRAALTQQEKDLLNMLLIPLSNEYTEQLQDSLNKLADAYILNYPGDLSLPFVRKGLRVVYEEKKSFSATIGGLYALPTKPMANYFNNYFGITGDLKTY